MSPETIRAARELEVAARLSAAVAPRGDALTTPCLVIDLDAVDHNLATVIAAVGDADRWRPHVKTVKQPAIVARMLAAGLLRYKCATLAELTMVLSTAEACETPEVDVLLAYAPHAGMLDGFLAARRRFARARLSTLADDPAHRDELAARVRARGEAPLRVQLDVDVGMGRTGIAAQRWQQDPKVPEGLEVVGLSGYEGHLAGHETAAIHDAADTLLALAATLGRDDLEILTSGTHAFLPALAHAGLRRGPWQHRVGPGTVVLGDRRSAPVMTAIGLRTAAFVATRVVARPDAQRFTLDAGSKAIAPDCPAPGCAVLGFPGLELATASEEHRPGRAAHGPAPARGDLLWLVPDHVCTTVNLHARALHLRGGVIVEEAPVVARGHAPSAEVHP